MEESLPEAGRISIQANRHGIGLYVSPSGHITQSSIPPPPILPTVEQNHVSSNPGQDSSDHNNPTVGIQTIATYIDILVEVLFNLLYFLKKI